jgi:hypothetical protein
MTHSRKYFEYMFILAEEKLVWRSALDTPVGATLGEGRYVTPTGNITCDTSIGHTVKFVQQN